MFAFHGKINKEIHPEEVGDFSGQARSKSNGWWSYENTQYQLQRGDVLHFWVYVQHGNFGYRLDNQRYVYPGRVFELKTDFFFTFEIEQLNVLIDIDSFEN